MSDEPRHYRKSPPVTLWSRAKTLTDILALDDEGATRQLARAWGLLHVEGKPIGVVILALAHDAERVMHLRTQEWNERGTYTP